MIEEAIIQAAREGRLKSLTLWRTPEGYQANVSSDGTAWTVHIDADPVRALRGALRAKPTETTGVFD